MPKIPTKVNSRLGNILKNLIVPILMNQGEETKSRCESHCPSRYPVRQQLPSFVQ